MSTELLKIVSRLCSSILVLAVMSGCGSPGPELHPVKGHVKFSDGRSVQGGTIEFTSVNGNISSVGRIGQDGSFSLTTNEDGDGTVVGKHKVIVIPGGVPITPGSAHVHGPAVPGKYSSYETSGLSADVTAGENDLVIEIDNSLK